MKTEFDRRALSRFDWPLFLCTMLILGVGLANLYSATYNLPVARYFRYQFVWTAGGVLIAFAATLPDYRVLKRVGYPIYGMVLFLLAFVLVKGKTALGAQRWLQVGSFSIQPSEMAKLAIVLCLAQYFQNRREKKSMGFLDLILPVLLALFPFVLILKQPDLGTALVLAFVAASMTLFMGVERKVLVIIFITILGAAPMAWKFLLHDYQKDRVVTFLNPEKFAQGKGYQVIQSKIAIGSGELIGKGYLKGTQSKLEFLPKQHTDFIFSNFAEEFGFLGSIFVLFLYLSFCLLGLNVSLTAKDEFGMVLAFGLTALISCQAVINLGMEMGALPVVGITLPLFSYGGTSLLTSLVAIGFLLNISMRRFIF